MKKFILSILVVVACSKSSNAQFDFGIKASYNFFKTVDEVEYTYILLPPEKINGDTSGFNAGIWTRVKIPILGLGVRPELNYVQLRSSIKGIKETYIVQKIDVPILLNKSFFLGILNVFVGPSFQYTIKDKDIEGLQAKDVSSSDFTMGIQYGVGVEIKNFGIDLRMDQSFGKDVSTFTEAAYTKTHKIDNRPSLFVIGLYYSFF